MSQLCHTYGKYLFKSFNLNRHKREVHGQKQTEDVRILADGSTLLQHPSCIVAECTQRGKTVWVKSPTLQRIIWCYGQWQPLYFDMVRTMPGIEFNEGIPEDIKEPVYLNVSQRNLIVLDDLMSQSGKSKRIAVSLEKEVITEIYLSYTLSRIYFIMVKGCEISVLMLIISYCLSHQQINNRFQCSRDNC